MKRWRCICNDCGVDIVKAGEYVMLDPQIWKHELGLDWDDNLCIGCVEKRLGRRIKGFGDIINMQNNVTTSLPAPDPALPRPTADDTNEGAV